jgi:hypothetical protein
VRLRSIVIALLLMSFFSAAAGAIYIEGQPTPDDGLIHIMSAGMEPGTTSTAMLPYNLAFPSFISGISTSDPGSTGSIPLPTGVTDIPFLTGMAGIDQGSVSPGSMPPSLPKNGFDIYPMPVINLPQPDSDGNIILGDTIGHIVSPPEPGYWDNLQDMDIHTNMPTVTMPAVYGI